MNTGAFITTKIDTVAVDKALRNLGVLMYDVPLRTLSRAAKRVMTPIKNAEKLAIHDDTGALRKSMGVRLKMYTGVATQGFAGMGPSLNSSPGVTGQQAHLTLYAIAGPRRVRYAETGGGKVKRTSATNGGIMPSRYAHLVEFGHKNKLPRQAHITPAGYKRYSQKLPNGGLVKTPAHPFIRKAFQSLSMEQIVSDFAREVKNGIDACDWNHSKCALPLPPTTEDLL